MLQVGTLNGVVMPGQGASKAVRLVPRVTTVFQDREEEFAELSGLADQMDAGGSRLWVITGDSGLGKTTLAVTWINQNRHRFGCAQIAMECGGGPGEGKGRSIEEVCDRYFALAGLDRGIADTLTAKIELLSSLIDGEPVALLLDDAHSAAQVLPFLSNLPGVLVLVTSRVSVPGLAQYRPRELHLKPLPDQAVAELFREIVGVDRVDAEPAAFARLIQMCAGLPLLASLAAGLLHDVRSLHLVDLVRRMTDQGRLAALEAGQDDSMARSSAVFEVTYRELSRAAARLYWAIGLHPVRDFDPGLVAALSAGWNAAELDGLDQLIRRGIVRSDVRGRYLMDDLTYEYAGQAAIRDADPAERTRIRSRIADYYLRGAIAASSCMSQRWTLSPLYGQDAPFPLPDFKIWTESAASGEGVDPVAWISENLPAIMACMERAGRAWESAGPLPGYQWQMAEATNAYFTAEGRNDERATILAWAEADADACGDRDAQARVQAQWGEMFLGQGLLDAAEDRFKRSLEAAEDGHKPHGVGSALEWLGITERRRGDPVAALAYFDQALRFLDPDRPRSQALRRMHRADALAMLGDRPAALRDYEDAAALFRQLAADGKRDHANEGKVLAGMAELFTKTDPDRARALLEDALALFQAAGRRYQQGKAWEALGEFGDGAQAWRKALELYESGGWRDAAARARARLQ